MPNWIESATVVWPIVVVAIMLHWRIVLPWLRETAKTAAWRQRMESELTATGEAMAKLAIHERECGARYEALIREIGDLRTQIAAVQASLK